MKITKTTSGNTFTFAVEGRLDTTTSPELESELSAAAGTAEKIVLDFSKLDYISSAGLRVLLATHKKMAGKGGLVITGVNEIVNEIFEITGFSDILDIQ
nr:STAS domain-containing protein [uncultured Ruminococcus sp.]